MHMLASPGLVGLLLIMDYPHTDKVQQQHAQCNSTQRGAICPYGLTLCSCCAPPAKVLLLLLLLAER